MTGIYKITSPNGRIYIGQAVDVFKRLLDYNYLDCKKQRRLYNSLKFYSFEKHNFEIIELCGESDLNYFERKWQDYYEVIGKNGLNCRLQKTTEKSGYLSEETKNLISKNSADSKKVIDTLTNIEYSSVQELIKSINSSTHNIYKKLQGYLINNTQFEYLIPNENGKGKAFEKRRPDNTQKRMVIDINTNQIFDSIVEASKYLGMQRKTLNDQLLGRRKNKTSLKYY